MIEPSISFVVCIAQAIPVEAGWSPLEVTKIVVSILTPMSVLVFGWLLNRRLKHIEHRQWANQTLIEKRLELYDVIAPKLNELLCFYLFIGRWKGISPVQALETKRFLDQQVHIYKYLLGDRFYDEYQGFINDLFKHFQGDGISASFRSQINTKPFGSRKENAHYKWEKEWDGWFTEEDRREQVKDGYDKVMNALKDTIEIYG